jgi:hypothetical protein
VQTWTIWHSQNGYELVLSEVPWWAHLASEVVPAIDAAVGHTLCGGGSPDWAWRLPLGRPDYDTKVDPEDPYLVNSLAARLSDAFTWVLCLPDRHGRELHRQHLTDAEAAELGATWHLDAEGDD